MYSIVKKMVLYSTFLGALAMGAFVPSPALAQTPPVVNTNEVANIGFSIGIGGGGYRYYRPWRSYPYYYGPSRSFYYYNRPYYPYYHYNYGYPSSYYYYWR